MAALLNASSLRDVTGLTLPGVLLPLRCPVYLNFCAFFGLRFSGMLITIQEVEHFPQGRATLTCALE
jgi:hypothetical protein